MRYLLYTLSALLFLYVYTVILTGGWSWRISSLEISCHSTRFQFLLAVLFTLCAALWNVQWHSWKACWKANRLPLVTLTALSVVVAGFYLAQVWRFTNWQYAAALDDTYIYLQYARNLAQGNSFCYNGTDEPSIGATSLFYTFILSLFFKAGFSAETMVYITYLLGLIFYASTGWLIFLLGERVGGRPVGWLAAILTQLAGLWVWGALNGMDTALFTMALMWVAVELSRTEESWYSGTEESYHGDFHEFKNSRHYNRLLFSLGLLGLARPEGMVFALLILGYLSVRLLWCKMLDKGLILKLALTTIAAISQPLYILLITGQRQANGMLTKALWYRCPNLDVLDRLTIWLHQIARLLPEFLMQNDGPGFFSMENYFYPFCLLFAVAGMAVSISAEWKKRYTCIILSIIVVFGLILTSFILHSRFRYQIPFMPLILLFSVHGLKAVSGIFAKRGLTSSSTTILKGFGVFWVGWSALACFMFSIVFAQNALYLLTFQKRVGEWLKVNTPPDSRVVVNDTGAIAYYSERFIYDSWGLTTHFVTQASNHGQGAVFEAFERQPVEALPDYFAIFPDSMDEFIDSGVAAEQLRTFEGLTISLCGSSRLMDVYKANWSHADLKGRPRNELGGHLLDSLDVADVVSESEHNYRLKRFVSGLVDLSQNLTTLVGDLYYDLQVPLVEGGRLIKYTQERFTMHLGKAKGDLWLKMRTNTSAVTLEVVVNGVSRGPWVIQSAGGWAEPEFRFQLSGEELKRDTITIELIKLSGESYFSAHYWLYE